MVVDIDADRFRDSFETYAAIGATEGGGLHRLALSDADREARDRLTDDLRDLGLDVRVDELGNMFARRPGRDPDAAPVLVGSHLDSQPYGGRFDGQLGVLTALETLRALDDASIETDRPIELVNWTNEEGSRFQPAMMGSGAFVGQMGVEEMLAVEDRDGRTVAEELERIGYAGDEPCRPRDVHANLELHVEQGPELEEQETSVGVVEGVYGLVWFRAQVRGEADHAGPTPMHLRRDALMAAADAITEIGDLPARLSTDAVTTVGELAVSPNSINVIPDRATFTVDARSYDAAVLDAATERIEEELIAACDRHDTSFDLTRVARNEPIEFPATVPSAVERAADAAGIAATRLVSGAGHDAQRLHEITDSGMLFVPSVGGKTHSEDEHTEWDDCVTGAAVYADATLELGTE